MINFTLRCANGHSHDEWFLNSGEFDKMSADGVLKCPDCGDTAISKGVMAPNLGSSSGGGGYAAEAPSCGMGGGMGGGFGGCAGGMCGMGHNH